MDTGQRRRLAVIAVLAVVKEGVDGAVPVYVGIWIAAGLSLAAFGAAADRRR